MKIREQKNHGKVKYVVDYYDSNGTRHQKFFSTKQEAEDFANENMVSETPGMSIQKLFKDFLAETRHQRKKKSHESSKYRLKQARIALKKIGVTNTRDLRPNSLPRLIEQLEKRSLSYHTVFSYVARAKSAFLWAIRRGIIDRQDVGDMRLRQPSKTKNRYLSKDEVNILLDAVTDTYLELPIALCLFAGLRRSEACRLKPEDIDLYENKLTVQKSKNGKFRVISLHERLRDILSRTDLDDGREYICLNQSGTKLQPDWFTHSFRDIADSLDFDDVSVHTLRHTFCSQLIRNGFTIFQVCKLAGHSDVKTTMRYSHAKMDSLVPAF